MSGQSAETGWNGPIRAVRTPGNRLDRRENSFCACSHAARTARRKGRRPGARNAQYAAEAQRRHRERRVHRHRPQPGIFAPRPRPRRAQGPGPSRRRRAREPPALQSPEAIRHRSTPRNALKDTGLGRLRASPIYMCVMPSGSVHELHTLCLPTVDRGRPFIVERSMPRVLSGEWTAPEAIQHITRQGRDGTAQGDLTVSRLAVTRLKYHPVPVRTVARIRFANRLVSTMSDAENLRKHPLKRGLQWFVGTARRGRLFVSRVPKQAFIVYFVPKSAGIWPLDSRLLLNNNAFPIQFLYDSCNYCGLIWGRRDLKKNLC